VLNQFFYRHLANDQERRQAMLRDQALDAGLAIHVYGGGAGGYFVRLQPLGTSPPAHPGYCGIAPTMDDALSTALAGARADRRDP
jgi:hypothetical protein